MNTTIQARYLNNGDRIVHGNTPCTVDYVQVEAHTTSLGLIEDLTDEAFTVHMPSDRWVKQPEATQNQITAQEEAKHRSMVAVLCNKLTSVLPLLESIYNQQDRLSSELDDDQFAQFCERTNYGELRAVLDKLEIV